MLVPEWIEDTARYLLEAQAEIRPLLIQHKPAVATSIASARRVPTITMTQGEASVLLRAALPVPLQGTSLAAQQAHLVAAMQALSGAILLANDPNRYPSPVDREIEAGVALLDALRAFLDVARWAQAGQRAHVRWPYDARGTVPITTVLRHQEAVKREQVENAPSPRELAAESRRRHPPLNGRGERALEKLEARTLLAHQVKDLVEQTDRWRDLPRVRQSRPRLRVIGGNP